MLSVREITTPKEIKQFIRFSWNIYVNDSNWIPPLILEQMNMLNKKKSPFFEFGEAAYFMAYRDGRPVGRITAHINRRHNEVHQKKDGFFGFYECLQDDEASRALLKTAEDWLRARGMNKIIGQENFTVYDEIGFMIKGWDAVPSTPVILETYTPKYYLDQIQKAGYQKEIDWIAFLVKDDHPLKESLFKIKERVLSRNKLTMRPVNLKRLDLEMPKLKTIFNGAWKENWGHYPFTDRQFDLIADFLKIIVDPRLCLLVEDQGKPVGCSVTVPDINPSVQKMNGRLFPLGIFHFLRGKKKAKGLRTFMMGVVQEYRGLGVDVAMVLETFEAGRKLGYKWSECSLIVETNKRMIDAMNTWGGDPYKVYRLFSKKL